MELPNSTSWMIDVTSMARILKELDQQKDITAVVDVQDEDLAGIGDMVLDGGPNVNPSKVISLIEMKKMSVYFSSGQSNIPKQNAVHCIRLEPFYYVKDLKKKHE